MMGILAVVNLLALMMMFPIAKRLMVDFHEQLKAGNDRPVFDPDKFPISMSIGPRGRTGIRTPTGAGDMGGGALGGPAAALGCGLLRLCLGRRVRGSRALASQCPAGSGRMPLPPNSMTTWRPAPVAVLE